VELRNIFARGRRRPADEHILEVARALDAAPPDHVAIPPAPQTGWTASRLELAEALWGEGFLAPGGGAEVLRLAAPLGASAASTLLLLGVGAGGPPRVLATDLGVWVSGFDTDPALVDLAARRLQRAGSAIAKRASAELWAPDSQAVRRQGFHHGLAIEALRHARPLDILPSVVQAIRPGGQFVLQELVATAPEATAQLTAWCAMERRSPELPVEQDITTNLAQLGLDVRVVEDQTDRHASLVLRGWRHMLGGLAGNKPTLAHAATMVAEAEIWMRRLRLMREGQLRLVRWNAIVPA
jgi:cyclopropane fatty-acyl-phospholipid synthase-like methyltransferase